MKLYTKTGDTGETSLFDNSRVRKSNPRVDAYGEIDEVNACIGVACSAEVSEEVRSVLEDVQKDLFALGALLADPATKIQGRVEKASITEANVKELEDAIDHFESVPQPLRRFILPGGSPAGAALHMARTVCRRAERRVVALGDQVEPLILIYLNRLSDLLFVLARAVNHSANIKETEW